MALPLAAYIVGGIVGGAVLDSMGSAQVQQAEREGARKARQAKLEARRAEKFASTKGKGLGSYGQISLSVDDDDNAGLKYKRKKPKYNRLQLDE